MYIYIYIYITKVLEDLLILAGVAPSVAAADVTNSMQVETALAAAMTPLDAERDEHGRSPRSFLLWPHV